jgi:ribosomal protein S18 acetylase RimI-like enzyme
MEIKPLSGTDPEIIWNGFSKAFADYEVQINRTQFMALIKRRGFDPDVSFAAFEGKENIIAFTLNGTGTFNGIPTAYDTGTGTVKEHRGKGLATKIFEHSLPFLNERNLKQYLLEVLQHNTGAVSVYTKLGFKVTREFNYFVQKSTGVIPGPDMDGTRVQYGRQIRWRPPQQKNLLTLPRRGKTVTNRSAGCQTICCSGGL